MNWEETIGCKPREFCDRLYATRPEWIRGAISHYDARYLFRRALEAGTATAIEIGTASGLSTAFLAHALRIAHEAGTIDADYVVLSYDIAKQFYADQTKPVGEATREMIDSDLIGHVDFRNPAVATDVAKEHGEDSLSFVFIDANHRHPWPALDMLALLPSLRSGAEVVLHDVDLPAVATGTGEAGAKHLFDDLQAEKLLDSDGDPPNIGSVIIPTDKESLRTQLLAIAARHDWQEEVPDEIRHALLEPDSGGGDG